MLCEIWDLEGKGVKGTRCYYGQVVVDLEKEDSDSGEDGGKVGERRWNRGNGHSHDNISQ